MQLAMFIGAVSVWRSDNLLPFLGLSLLNGCIWSFWGWAGIGHEFYHRRFFRSSRLNQYLFVVCGVITWSNFGYFSVTHRRHHANTLGELDPEDQSDRFVSLRQLPTLMTIDIPGFLRRLRVLVLNATGSLPNVHVYKFSVIEQRDIVRGARSVLFVHVAWLGIVVVVLRSPAVLLLTSFAPWTFRILNVLLERAQHLGGTRGSTSAFDTTRTLLLPKPISWIYAGMNYHVEHHLFPFVPGYRLSRISKLIRDQHQIGNSLLRIRETRRVASNLAKLPQST